MKKEQRRTISSILLAALTIPLLVCGSVSASAAEEGGYDHPAYVSGHLDGTFCPDETLTRAEAAQIFYNLCEAGRNRAAGDPVGVFSDVTSDAWYYAAVSYISSQKIMNGDGEGRFRPGDDITRAELLAATLNYAGIAATGECTFSDVSVDHWAYGYIAAAVNAGIVFGFPNGTFRPDKSVTRAEAITMINRALGITEMDSGTTFSDVPQSHWAYGTITAAATGRNDTIEEESIIEQNKEERGNVVPGTDEEALPEEKLALIYNETNYESEFESGKVLVGMRSSVLSVEGEALLDPNYASTFFGLDIVEVYELLPSKVLVLILADDSRQGVIDAIGVLKDHLAVLYAEPNYITSLAE